MLVLKRNASLLELQIELELLLHHQCFGLSGVLSLHVLEKFHCASKAMAE